jgi:hypothetical protein
VAMRCKRQVHAVMTVAARRCQLKIRACVFFVRVLVPALVFMGMTVPRMITLECHVAVRADAKHHTAYAGTEHNQAHPASQNKSQKSVSGIHKKQYDTSPGTFQQP